MRFMTLAIAVALFGWTAATLNTMTQTPRVAIAAKAACAEAGQAWFDALSARGFDVEREAPSPDSDACLTGRAGGFDLEGAVSPAAVAALLKKRPKGLYGLSVVEAPPGVVLALNRDGSRSTFMDAQGRI